MSLAERLERIDDFRWRLPRDDSLGMRTDVVVYATKQIIDKIAKDKSLEQAANVATLPGNRRAELGDARYSPGLRFPHRRRGGDGLLEWRGLSGRRGVRHQLRRAAGSSEPQPAGRAPPSARAR